jgi:hypothetical protein
MLLVVLVWRLSKTLHAHINNQTHVPDLFSWRVDTSPWYGITLDTWVRGQPRKFAWELAVLSSLPIVSSMHHACDAPYAMWSCHNNSDTITLFDMFYAFLSFSVLNSILIALVCSHWRIPFIIVSQLSVFLLLLTDSYDSLVWIMTGTNGLVFAYLFYTILASISHYSTMKAVKHRLYVMLGLAAVLLAVAAWMYFRGDQEKLSDPTDVYGYPTMHSIWHVCTALSMGLLLYAICMMVQGLIDQTNKHEMESIIVVPGVDMYRNTTYLNV